MGKMSNEQIWKFARDFAKKLYGINEYWLHTQEIRTRDITISLYYLSCLAEAEYKGYEEYCEGGDEYNDGLYESDDKLESIIPKIAEDETVEAVIFCEGDLWETLYYCEVYGRGDEESRAIYQAFVTTIGEHGMQYEFGSGIIYLCGVS